VGLGSPILALPDVVGHGVPRRRRASTWLRTLDIPHRRRASTWLFSGPPTRSD